MVSEDLHEIKSGSWQNRSGGGLRGGGRPHGGSKRGAQLRVARGA